MQSKDITLYGDRHPVNATQAAATVSARYQFLSTSDILAQFAKAGWQPVAVDAAYTRKVERLGYQKHMVRLEHPDYQLIPGMASINDTKPQLVVINSHDRAASLRIAWGMFRLVCLNGMVTGRNIGEVRLRHSASVLERLPAAIASMLNTLPSLIENTQRLQRTQLSAAATAHLIKTIYDARLANTPNVVSTQYQMPALRRAADQASDAYTIFNRLQEVALRGGIRYITKTMITDGAYPRRFYRDADGDYTLRNGTTRAVTSIAESVRINTKAFDAVLEAVG